MQLCAWAVIAVARWCENCILA